MKKILNVSLILLLAVFVLCSCKSSSEGDDADSKKTEEFERLATLPYASWVEAKDESEGGVTVYKKDEVFSGLNLYCSRNQKEACLYDLNGKCLKRWAPEISEGEHWQYADLDSKGNFYFLEKRWDALVADKKSESSNAIGKLSQDGKVSWYRKGRFHHDFTFMPDGNVITLGRQERVVNWKGQELPLLDDKIWIINSADGELIKEYSAYNLFKDYISKKNIKQLRGQADFEKILQAVKDRKSDEVVIRHDEDGDIFHINSIVVLDREVEGFSNKGDYLISLRELNLVAVLSSDFKTVKWSSQNEFKKQHQPTLLENNNILVFDNQWKKGFSRVAEMDVKTKKIVWEYAATEKDEFFSRTRGGAQRLPNGNTLIADSNQGRLLEVNRAGEVVWNFLNTHEVEKKDKKLRAAIYRVKRFSEEEISALFPGIIKK